MRGQKIFFSYSRHDSAFALRLARDLREAGGDIWIDQLDIPAGKPWDEAVESALSASDSVLVILTPFSKASNNVMDEISFALDAGKKIIPVLWQACTVPLRLKRLNFVDFTGTYEEGLSILLRTLKLEPVLAEAIGSTDPHHVAVLNDRERKLWNDACRLNTIEGFEFYLNQTETDEYKGEAHLLIKQLEIEEKENELESLVWDKAQKANSQSLYEHYLREFPEGDYKRLAVEALAALEKQEKPDTFHSEPNEQPHQTTNPKTFFSSLAKKIWFGSGIAVFGLLCWAITAFTSGRDNEMIAWNEALWQNDSLSYEAYLKLFPTGKFHSRARKKLDSFKLATSIEAQAAGFTTDAPSLSGDTLKTPTHTTSLPVQGQKTNTTPKKVVSKYSIGQAFQGGLIVNIDHSGDHGLVMAAKDINAQNWSTANKKCEAYRSDGYTDWRLPTKEELIKIYSSKKFTTVFQRGCYWSSSKADDQNIWGYNFTEGKAYKFSPDKQWPVRAVHSF